MQFRRHSWPAWQRSMWFESHLHYLRHTWRMYQLTYCIFIDRILTSYQKITISSYGKKRLYEAARLACFLWPRDILGLAKYLKWCLLCSQIVLWPLTNLKHAKDTSDLFGCFRWKFKVLKILGNRFLFPKFMSDFFWLYKNVGWLNFCIFDDIFVPPNRKQRYKRHTFCSRLRNFNMTFCRTKL